MMQVDCSCDLNVLSEINALQLFEYFGGLTFFRIYAFEAAKLINDIRIEISI